VHSICTIFTLPHPFPKSSALPFASINPQADLFCPPVLQLYKRKKMIFSFVIATQVFSLWHFHVYMYYNSYWFITSVFLSFFINLPVSYLSCLSGFLLDFF
jgi:hypothetical protein